MVTVMVRMEQQPHSRYPRWDADEYDADIFSVYFSHTQLISSIVWCHTIELYWNTITPSPKQFGIIPADFLNDAILANKTNSSEMVNVFSQS